MNRFTLSKKIILAFFLLSGVSFIVAVTVYFGLAALHLQSGNFKLLQDFQFQVKILERLHPRPINLNISSHKNAFDEEIKKTRNLVRQIAIYDTDIKPDLSKRLQIVISGLDHYKNAYQELIDKFEQDSKYAAQKKLFISSNVVPIIEQLPDEIHAQIYKLLLKLLSLQTDAYNERDLAKIVQMQSLAKMIAQLTDKPAINETISNFVNETQKNYINFLGIRNRQEFLLNTSDIFLDISKEMTTSISSQIKASRNRLIRNIYGLLIGSIILTIVLWYLASRYFHGFLNHQNQAIKAIKIKNYDYAVTFTSNDELGDLTRFLKELALDLKESREHVHNILSSAAEAIYGIDMNGNCTFANAACVKILGFQNDTDLLGKNIHDLIHHTKADGKKFSHDQCQILNVLRQGKKVYEKDEVMWKHDNTCFPAEYWAYPINRNSRLVGAVVTFFDISERLRAENQLRYMQQYLKNVVDSMPSMIVGVDIEGVVNQWNIEAEKLSGLARDQAMGRPLDDVLPMFVSRMEQIKNVITSHKPEINSRVQIETDDELQFFNIMIYPLVTNGIEGAVVRVDDVTERVRLGDMMVQTEKIISVGGLAAGMAHEINNPLGGILQGAQNILRRISPEISQNSETAKQCDTTLDAVRLYMEKRQILKILASIKEAGERSAKIVANMLQFSRRSVSTITQNNLPALIDRTIELAGSDYNLKKKYDFKKIEIVRDFNPQLITIPCVATEIEQVLLNFLKNAAHAVSGQKDSQHPPKIIVRTRKEGQMAHIEIQDNGCGMDEKTKKRVFEPFFTTKEVGTGLGLSVSYFIVSENHKGSIEVKSAPGKGAKFIIRLPLKRAVG